MSSLRRVRLEELFFLIITKNATQQHYEYFFACISKSDCLPLTSYAHKICSYLSSHIETYFEYIAFNTSFCINLAKNYLIQAYHSLKQQGSFSSSSKLSTVVNMVKYYNSNKPSTVSSFEITVLNVLFSIHHKVRSHETAQTENAIAKSLLSTVFTSDSAMNNFLSLDIETQSITVRMSNVNETTMNEELSILYGINDYLDTVYSLKTKGDDVIKLISSRSLSNHFAIQLLIEYAIESFSYDTLKKLIEKHKSKENTVDYYVKVCYFISKMKHIITISRSEQIKPKLITAISTDNNVNKSIINIPKIVSIGLAYPSIGTCKYFSEIYTQYYISQHFNHIMNSEDSISLLNYFIILLHVIYHTQNKANIIESTLTDNSYDVFFDLCKILCFSRRFTNLTHSVPIQRYIPTPFDTIYTKGTKVQIQPQIQESKSKAIETISSTIDQINKEYASQNICVFHIDKKKETICDDKECLFIIKCFPETENAVKKLLTINGNLFVLVACFDSGKDIAYYLIENNKWYYRDKHGNINAFTKHKNKTELSLIYMKVDSCDDTYSWFNKTNIEAITTYTSVQEVEMLASLRYLVAVNCAFLNHWAPVYKNIISKHAKLIGEYILDKYKKDEDLNDFLVKHVLPKLQGHNLPKKLNDKIMENK